jgi:hypothetical protein
MSFFDFFKRPEPRNFFGGGNGESFETAVIVNAGDSAAGIDAEYGYITSQCGRRNKDWTARSQALHDHDGKPYDVLTIQLSNGEERTFYFDISNFFGK